MTPILKTGEPSSGRLISPKVEEGASGGVTIQNTVRLASPRGRFFAASAALMSVWSSFFRGGEKALESGESRSVQHVLPGRLAHAPFLEVSPWEHRRVWDTRQDIVGVGC